MNANNIGGDFGLSLIGEQVVQYWVMPTGITFPLGAPLTQE